MAQHRLIPWYEPRRLLRLVIEARRYPLLPTFILLAVMIIPAIFAPWIAPHPPKGELSSLSRRLTPPAWISEKSDIKIVVEQVGLDKYDEQVELSNAQRHLRLGTATILDGSEALSIGSQVLIISKRAGTKEYFLGTDKVGRDILSRIIYGSRISIIVAGIAIFVGGVIGTVLGIMAGYFGGWADSIIMRLVDISLSIPIILLALVLAAALGPSFKTVIIVLVVLLWARYARMARGETLGVRNQDFVARARVSGASHFRIMVRHIFPNVFNSLVVLATLQVGWVIIAESTLSFLGAGIPRPNPAWGLMVADGRELIISDWWVSFFPGLAILFTVMSANMLGDWLRDHLDPKQRNI